MRPLIEAKQIDAATAASIHEYRRIIHHIFFMAKEGVALSDLPEATMLQKEEISSMIREQYPSADTRGRDPTIPAFP